MASKQSLCSGCALGLRLFTAINTEAPWVNYYKFWHNLVGPNREDLVWENECFYSSRQRSNHESPILFSTATQTWLVYPWIPLATLGSNNNYEDGTSALSALLVLPNEFLSPSSHNYLSPPTFQWVPPTTNCRTALSSFNPGWALFSTTYSDLLDRSGVASSKGVVPVTL